MPFLSPNQQLTDVSRVTGSAILAGSGQVMVSMSDPMFDPILSFNNVHLSWHCFYRVTPPRQTNIRGFGFSSDYWLLISVIFTYLRADCPCDVTTFLDLTSFMLLLFCLFQNTRSDGFWPGDWVKSHRVGWWVINPDPVPSLQQRQEATLTYEILMSLFEY